MLSQACYWLPGLLRHSLSCFLVPWASRTYDPCQCRAMTYNMYNFFVALRTVGNPASVTVRGLCGLLTAPQPLQASFYSFLETVLSLAEVHSSGSWPGDLLYGSSTCSGARLKRLLMTSLPTTRGTQTVWSEGTSLVPSLANLSASSFPEVP